MKITIRHEKPSDISTIAELTTTAFLNAEHTSHKEQYIVSALRDNDALTLSLVAELNGILVGHASISPVVLDNNDSGWYGLAPVSVLPDYQNQGVGTSLIQQILSELRKLSAKGCVVLGDPNYYSRFGFEAQHKLTLTDVPQEYFQAIVFHGELPRSNVYFNDAFNVKA